MDTNKYVAEFIGTLFLLLVVVGSGIMGERLADGNMALALLANAIATGAGLYVLISVFSPISGAHFNPVVSTYMWLKGGLSRTQWAGYIAFQVLGAVAGVLLCHFIFKLPILETSAHARDGWPQLVSEGVATFGLLLTIMGFSQARADHTPMGVALYITGAYWFTSSTSFANPAVTIARTLTDTFAGIAPHSAPGYIVAQFVGLTLFMYAWPYIAKPVAETADP